MEFKVGMRVKANVPVGTKRLDNQIGTVLGIRASDGRASIEFDNLIGGHSCRHGGYNGKHGHCWNVEKEFLESTDLTPDQAFEQLINGHITEDQYREAVELHGD